MDAKLPNLSGYKGVSCCFPETLTERYIRYLPCGQLVALACPILARICFNAP